MSETKHTPGPWYVRFGGRPEDDGWCIASRSNSDPIVVAESWPRVLPAKSQLMANARLIAVAPELLEALRSMVEASDWYDPTEAQAAAFDEATAALAKAEGRAK